MAHKNDDSNACEAWSLLLQFFFSQRSSLPPMAAEFQLSPAQCHVLKLIEPGRPMPMGKLAENLSCDASNVTGLVDRLESRGLVRRHPSSEDRRIKVLELTPVGARLRGIVLERIATPPESLDRLSAEDQRALVRILKRLMP